MKKYICAVCGYVYDEALGIPDFGILPGTKWEDLPEDWVCPLCGAAKSEFTVQDKVAPLKKARPVIVPPESPDMKALSPLEMSALCSNLAKGCEKQYMAEAAACFTELAQYFKSVAAPTEAQSFDKLLALIEKDLNSGFPAAVTVSSDAKDRGALRALTWSEKVTRIQKSLLAHYQDQGHTKYINTTVYVCSICGFIHVGDIPPQSCPVCKVPGWKFDKIEGGQQ